MHQYKEQKPRKTRDQSGGHKPHGAVGQMPASDRAGGCVHMPANNRAENQQHEQIMRSGRLMGKFQLRVQNKGQQDYRQHPVLSPRTHGPQPDRQHRRKEQNRSGQAGFHQ